MEDSHPMTFVLSLLRTLQRERRIYRPLLGKLSNLTCTHRMLKQLAFSSRNSIILIQLVSVLFWLQIRCISINVNFTIFKYISLLHTIPCFYDCAVLLHILYFLWFISLWGKILRYAYVYIDGISKQPLDNNWCFPKRESFHTQGPFLFILGFVWWHTSASFCPFPL